LVFGTRADINRDMANKGRANRNSQVRDEDHANAKLAAALVAAIIRRYCTQRALAAEYGVYQRTVAKILNGLGWKDVKVDPATTEVR
jgi:hypothetical protein